jgi:hypothetical protein
LENFLRPKIEEYGEEHNLEDFWFQQDGATAHTTRRPHAILKMFPGRVVSLHEAVPWPLRSPDLSPCDFFLWGYLKAEVFKHRPRTLDQLKEAIQEETEGIAPDVLVRVLENFQERLYMCIGHQGHHLDDIIFKTYCNKTFLYLHVGNKKFLVIIHTIFFASPFAMWELFLPHPVLTY